MAVLVEPPGEQPEDQRRRHERPGQEHRLARQRDRADHRQHRGAGRNHEPPGRAPHEPRRATARAAPARRPSGSRSPDRAAARNAAVSSAPVRTRSRTASATPADIARRARAAPATPPAPPCPQAARPARTSPRTAADKARAARRGIPAPTNFASMSPPTESVKKVSPARQKIATNHGSTSTSSHIRPQTGRSRHSHAAERSRIASVTIGQPDEHQDQRPLEQDAAGQRRPEDRGPAPGRMRGILAALPGQIDPRHRAHRRDHGEQQHRVGLGEPRFGAEQHRTAHDQAGQDAPRRSRTPAPSSRSEAPRRSRRSARECGTARSAPAPAAGPAPRRFRPRPPAASRCRPASCSGPRPGSGCRRNRRSRPSAWSPARTAPRRGRSAEW